MHTHLQDLVYSLRTLRKAPGFTAAVVLSESLARLAYPGRAAVAEVVGEVFELGGTTYTVVGVAGEVHQAPGAVRPLPMAYTSFAQRGGSPWSMLALHTRLDPPSLIPALRSAVLELDPEQPIYGLTTMEERISRAAAPRRFNALLLGSFAALALILAALGLYALIAYLVAQRTREIGVWIALGAGRRDLLRLVLREGLLLTVIGIAAGLVGAVGLTRLVASLLYGVGALDPATFAVVPVAFIAVAVVASWVPARRAARADPMVALRAE